MNEEFCQKLVQTASLAVGRDVLVTDEQGIILANSDRTRIGEVHEASLEVMRKQEKIYHGNYEAGRLNATLPGVTMPLLVDGVTVGSIGIIRRADLNQRILEKLAEIFRSPQDFFCVNGNGKFVSWRFSCRKRSAVR